MYVCVRTYVRVCVRACVCMYVLNGQAYVQAGKQVGRQTDREIDRHVVNPNKLIGWWVGMGEAVQYSFMYQSRIQDED